MTMGVQASSSWSVPQRDAEETSMDPTTTCCPTLACPASGQSGQGTMGLHARKDKRFLGTECPTPCSATQGPGF